MRFLFSFFLARYVCINKANMEPEVCLAKKQVDKIWLFAGGLKVNQGIFLGETKSCWMLPLTIFLWQDLKLWGLSFGENFPTKNGRLSGSFTSPADGRFGEALQIPGCWGGRSSGVDFLPLGMNPKLFKKMTNCSYWNLVAKKWTTWGSQNFAYDAAFVTFCDRRHAEFARRLKYSESIFAESSKIIRIAYVIMLDQDGS